MGDTLTNRVRRGARLIDERLGRTALRRIRIRELDVASACDCVLGQLYGGDYFVGIDALGIDGLEQSAHLGFAVGLSSEDADRAYDRLTELWADEVRRRRGKAS